MKLVTFGIDDKRNLIIQFLVFVQPYTQQHLTLYQMDTVPLRIVDENEQVQCYTYLKVKKPYIALYSETYILFKKLELVMWAKVFNLSPLYNKHKVEEKHCPHHALKCINTSVI